MVTKQSVPSPADLQMRMLVDATQAYLRAPVGPKRVEAGKELLKSYRAFGLNDAETAALSKILSQPGELAEMAVKTIDALAGKKAQQLIELQRKWSDAFMRQGDSIAGIAGAARAIATIASMFGADEFADMLNAKADEQMIKAEVQYAKGRDKMLQDSGTTHVVRAAVRDGLAIVAESGKGASFVGATEEAAATASRAEPVTPDSAIENGAAPAAPAVAPVTTPTARANTPITWKKFQENMESVGVSKAAQAQMRNIFDTSAKYDRTKKPDVIDAPFEVDKLVAGIKRTDALTEEQKNKLYKKLNLPTPELALNN